MKNVDHLPTLAVETFWMLLGEAYDVLSNELLRHVYDTYGEEGLKYGVPAPDGFVPPYKYHGDPMKTYQEAMGTTTPYIDLADAVAHPPTLYTTAKGTGVKEKDKDIHKLLYVDLKEVFYGTVKKYKIFRHELEGECQMVTKLKAKIIDIPIQVGCLVGTRIRMPEMGDQCTTRIPADYVFEIVDKPCENMERRGSDICMTFDISLLEALTGFPLTICTIDNKTFNIAITDIVHPEYIKQIPNEGMPLVDNEKQRGSLIASFRIKFPVYLTSSTKEKLTDLLRPNKGSFQHHWCYFANKFGNVNRITPIIISIPICFYFSTPPSLSINLLTKLKN